MGNTIIHTGGNKLESAIECFIVAAIVLLFCALLFYKIMPAIKKMVTILQLRQRRGGSRQLTSASSRSVYLGGLIMTYYKIMFKKCLLLTFFMYILLLFGSCINICKNEIQKIEISPDEKYKAIAFIRSCGATTSFSPQVSLLSKNERFSDRNKGNIFIGNNSKDIDIYWENNSCLVILHNIPEEDIFLKNNNYENIYVKYLFQ